MNYAKLWPVAIGAALGFTVLANGVLLYAAGRDGGAEIEPDYYRKAVAWDSTIAQAHRNVALGWQLQATLSQAGTLTVTLADRAGLPLTGATITTEGFALAGGNRTLQATLAPVDHSYRAGLTLQHQGIYELRFLVMRGSERFTAVMRGTPGGPLTGRS
ncbi:MAG: FixH family protein [Gemmatimonadota bacterium]